MAARVALRRLAYRLLPAETSGRLARASIVSERGFATTQANELRVGAIVKRKDGALLEVTKYSYTQGQARGSGHVQVEYRDLRTGSKAQERLSPSDKLERAVLDSEVSDARPVVPHRERTTTKAISTCSRSPLALARRTTITSTPRGVPGR